MKFFTDAEKAILHGVDECFRMRGKLPSHGRVKDIYEKYVSMITKSYNKKPSTTKEYLNNIKRRAKKEAIKSKRNFVEVLGEIVGYEAYIVNIAANNFNQYVDISNYASLIIGKEIIQVRGNHTIIISGCYALEYAQKNPEVVKVLEKLGISIYDLDPRLRLHNEESFIDNDEEELPELSDEYYNMLGENQMSDD